MTTQHGVPATPGTTDGRDPARPGVLTRRRLVTGTAVLGGALALGTQPASAAVKLRKGDRGSDVTRLQRRLAELHYWCGSADGSFGSLTQQAVWALQKSAGLGKDGVVGPKTWAALDRGAQPSRKVTSGTAFEVNKAKQLIIATSRGRLLYILNTSTGSGERYYSGGRWKTATTPSGDFSMFRFHSSGWQTAPLGKLYRPGYYDRGWAIHGSTSIPPYPASHGCSRISVAASDMLWSQNWFREGRRVLVY